ncbi:MAG: sodium ion-translocating decarboxylase subunit beta [Oscillospiraceae bacterium]|jgi:oxaloacetate decarboxylase beta subunit|nr:sodium ion-translocating decarboxylase subunit beta [Oscillospiraceae bacterium]
MFQTVIDLWMESGFAMLTIQHVIMILISFVLIYLAIGKGFEPLLLLPIAFGMLLANLPMGGLFAEPEVSYTLIQSPELLPEGASLKTVIEGGQTIYYAAKTQVGGLIYYLYQGVKLGIYPSLIFLGIGTMTDFGPLIARPSSFLLGAAAQVGIFVTFIGAIVIGALVPSIGFTAQDAGAIGIIGGADGPTAIYTATKLSPELLPSIAIAAYSYMALVPIIQPPIMRLLTTHKERSIVMEQLRPVSKTEKIVFPILVAVFCILLIPSTAPLIGMLMLGNLMKESGVVERLTKTAGNELMNIVTIFLGISVGATANAERFLTPRTLGIIVLGLIAFSFGTAGGVLLGKLMSWATKGKINPLIGSAGVSAVPMAARVSQRVGQETNPNNYLLMHAMGPNVAGVIGSAVAAGVLISVLG